MTDNIINRVDVDRHETACETFIDTVETDNMRSVIGSPPFEIPVTGESYWWWAWKDSQNYFESEAANA